MAFRFFTNPLILFVAALSAALLIPALFMDGMFMDGLLYTCVGKNLGNGIGSFWDPQFSTTYMQSYHEQPPLMFGLLAVFFKVLGNGLYTERVYCLLLAIACFFAMRFVWNEIFHDNENRRQLFWLPAIFFFCSPVTFWAYANNVEESTMVVFALLSVGFQLRGIRANGNGTVWFLLGGIAVTLSTLCKGLQGGFPIIVPLLWYIAVRTITLRKALLGNLLVALAPVLFYTFAALYEPARNSYLSYFHDRIAATFTVSETATTSSRFFILFELLLNTLPALAICSVLALFVRRFANELRSKAVFFFVLGMSGILPLMVTLEQRGFYLLTALPFVMIFMALPLTAAAERLSQLVAERKILALSLKVLALLMVAGTLFATITLAGTPKRDKDMLHDVQMIGELVPEGSVISADPESAANWSLLGYLNRYHTISVDRSGAVTDYHIAAESAAPPIGYRRITPETRVFHLYAKTSAPSAR
jgi:4-amino-4-deoxy-L-arabinose transferase-like glycosyltransferase